MYFEYLTETQRVDLVRCRGCQVPIKSFAEGYAVTRCVASVGGVDVMLNV